MVDFHIKVLIRYQTVIPEDINNQSSYVDDHFLFTGA